MKIICKIIVLCFVLLTLQASVAEDKLFYCKGDQCPKQMQSAINNEYPHAICAKEYRCAGDYVAKAVANLCGCCACNGGSCGCAGGSVMCCDGTLSQVCRCNFQLN